MTEIETFSRLDNAAAKQDLHRQIQIQEEFWKEERRTQRSDMTSSRNLYTKKRTQLSDVTSSGNLYTKKRRTCGIESLQKLQVLIKISLKLGRGRGMVHRDI